MVLYLDAITRLDKMTNDDFGFRSWFHCEVELKVVPNARIILLSRNLIYGRICLAGKFGAMLALVRQNPSL